MSLVVEWINKLYIHAKKKYQNSTTMKWLQELKKQRKFAYLHSSCSFGKLVGQEMIRIEHKQWRNSLNLRVKIWSSVRYLMHILQAKTNLVLLTILPLISASSYICSVPIFLLVHIPGKNQHTLHTVMYLAFHFRKHSVGNC